MPDPVSSTTSLNGAQNCGGGAASTRERILDAALELFAIKGFGSSSMREITQRAKVSLALVNYHFQSKDLLKREVVLQRLAPVNAERLERLDALETRYGDEPIPLEELAEAVVRPMIMRPDGSIRRWELLAKFILRCLLAAEDDFRNDSYELHLKHMFERFQAALQRSLPEDSLFDVFWKMHFFGGTMMMSLATPERLDCVSDGACPREDPEELISRLVAFLCDGSRARFSYEKRNPAEKKNV